MSSAQILKKILCSIKKYYENFCRTKIFIICCRFQVIRTKGARKIEKKKKADSDADGIPDEEEEKEEEDLEIEPITRRPPTSEKIEPITGRPPISEKIRAHYKKSDFNSKEDNKIKKKLDEIDRLIDQVDHLFLEELNSNTIQD